MRDKEYFAKQWALTSKQGCDHSEVQQHAYIAGYEKALSLVSTSMRVRAQVLKDTGLVATHKAIAQYADEILEM